MKKKKTERNQKYQYKKASRESARDVGRHVSTKNLRQKRRYIRALELFLKEVFPEKFYRPFSGDQKKFIRKIQESVLLGESIVVAMPRGEGKTTIIQCAIIWAIVYGHKRYPVIIAADQAAAEKILDGIKATLEANPKLMELFPEICHYVRSLCGLSQRAAGQLANGKQTHIKWRSDQIVLPSVKTNKKKLEFSSGAVIEARGLTGRLRGLQETLPGGEVIRPDFVFLDDPQTRESANSPAQCLERENLIKSDVMGLVGIGKKLSFLMGCTVIREGDLADRMLNDYGGIRAKALYKFPNEKDGLWREYIDTRRRIRRNEDPKQWCNVFYGEHRKEMDLGGEVGNEYRVNEGDLSALQACYNFIADNGEAAFQAEWQNDPVATISTIYDIYPMLIEKKASGFKRLEIPSDCHYVNLGIDINYYALNWAISAVQNDMTGYCIDYGQYPNGRPLWTQGSSVTAEQAIYDGVIELVNAVFTRNPGLKMVGIDGNYATDTVYRVAAHLDKTLPIRVIVMRGVASDKFSLPMERKKVIQEGYECFMRSSDRGPACIFNSHFWHSHLQKAFFLNPGFAGSYSLFGDTNTDHSVIASHICADRLIDIESRGGKQIYKWTRRPSERNDLADALVMSLVPASIFGADVTAGKAIPKAEQKKEKPDSVSRPRVTYINI